MAGGGLRKSRGRVVAGFPAGGKESQSQQAWDPGDALGRRVPATSCSVGTQVGNVALTDLGVSHESLRLWPPRHRWESSSSYDSG